jgi:activating signal cointegrator 1
MYVLSLLQPWASLIVMGVKTIETRRWQTAHRGPLLIHSGQRKAGALITLEPPIAKHISSFDTLAFGSIIGQVNLVDIIPVASLHLSPIELAQQSLELNAFGEDENLHRYAWMMEDAVQFKKPIPAKGHLHLWKFETEGPVMEGWNGE